VPSATSSPYPVASPTPTGSAAAQAGGLSTGAMVAVIVGAVLAVIIAGAAVGFVWFRRVMRRRANSAGAGGNRPTGGFFSLFRKQSQHTRLPPSSPPGTFASGSFRSTNATSKNWEGRPLDAHELDGQWRGYEMHHPEFRGELDSVARVELDARQGQYGQWPTVQR